MSAPTKAAKTAAPITALVALLVALLGKHPVGLSEQQIGQYVAAVAAGITAALHAPTIAKKTKAAKSKAGGRHHGPRVGHPTPEFVDAMDSIGATAGNIPRGCKRILAYITGTGGIAWTAGQINAAAKHADVVAIDQSNGTFPFLNYRTLILDCEPGAKTNANAVEQTRLRNAHGLRTTLYTPLENVAALAGEIHAAGLTDVDWIVADWNFDRDQAIAYIKTNPGVVGVQYASPSSNPNTIAPGTNRTLRELNIDLSVTRGSWSLT